MSAVATIVRCTDLVGRIHATLESVGRQTVGCGEVVLATDDSTPIAALAWIDALARARGFRRAHAAGMRPGVLWNAGIEQATSPYVVCLEAGEVVAPEYYALAGAELDRGGLDLVTSWVRIVGPGQEFTAVSSGCSLDALLDDPDAIHPSSMFTRRAWLAAGLFDEQLPALVEYDLWLGILSGGGRATLLEGPLLIRTLAKDAAHRRRWTREAELEPWRQIVERHADAFGRDPARVLCARETRLAQVGQQYLEALEEQNRIASELGALQARAAGLRDALPLHLRDVADFGDLRRVSPVSRNWGCERGSPVDRYYIERFLKEHASDIRGVVLEVQKPDYASFGGSLVVRTDIVDIDASNPSATIVSDLRCAANIPSNTYDAVILTQTLHVIDDMRAVVAECLRVLKPGGVLLATLPAASRVCLEYGWDGDYWRITEGGARALFADAFPAHAVQVRVHGNALTNAAFLYGLAAHELSDAEFSAFDPYFPLLVTVRAEKPTSQGRLVPKRCGGEAWAAVLMYHRVGYAEPDVHGLSVPAEEFRRHMAYVRERCMPMSLEDLASAAREGKIPDRAVAVTFDDGYVDNLTEASPVLLELGIPATFFLTTNRWEEEERYEYWWDALERLMLRSGTDSPPDLRLQLPDGERVFSMRNGDERTAAHWTVYQAIIGSPAHTRDALIDALGRWNPAAVPVPATAVRMSRQQILELASRPGHAIGAHSSRHLMLPRQPLAVQREEIEGSRKALEALSGRPVGAFAYPFGAYAPETVAAVRAAGFETAVTCEAAYVTGLVDPLRLPRLAVRPGADLFRQWIERSA